MNTHKAPNRASRLRLLRIVGAGVALACAAGFVMMLYKFDGAAVRTSLRAIEPWWPSLLLLELARIGCEVVATRSLLGGEASRLPMRKLLRGQLFGQMLDVLMPAGRTSAETAKAILYARDVGWPAAAAIGTALQLVVLIANSAWVLLSYCNSRQLGLLPVLRIGLLTYTVFIGALVFCIVLFATAPVVRQWFQRMPIIHASLEHFAVLLAGRPHMLLVPLLAQLTSRCSQALQLAITITALGAHPTLTQTQVTQALYIVGTALGEFTPAQVGTTDALFVLAAPALGLSAQAAFAATLALHAVQIVIALCSGAGSCVLWWLDVRQSRA